MARRLAVSAILLVSLVAPLAPSARAGSWADAFFPVREQDFGKVQRGTVLNHQFVLNNTLATEIRIKGLRVSCGCTKATAGSTRLAPGESTTIDATMDTSGFQGNKSVTVFVQFDRPRRSEVPLRLSCVSVGTSNQGASEVDFGIVPAGKEVIKRMNVDYAGTVDWRVTGLDFGNPHVRAEIQELARDKESGKVRYELVITLAPTAPPGTLEDQIRIHTNDPKEPEVLVLAKAKVEAEIVVSPDNLRLSDLVPGQRITKNVIVKAQTPFRVTRVDNNTAGLFEIRSAPTPKTTQLVMVTLIVPEDLSSIPNHIDLVTDIDDEKVISIGVRD